MSRIWIDASYYAFFYGYHVDTENPYAFIENVIGPQTFIAIDSKTSIRKNSLSWYKANRKDAEHSQDANGYCLAGCKRCISNEYRRRVDNILAGLQERYPNNCLMIDGYEADDIIAMNVLPTDIVFVNDKDYLTIPTRAKLMTFKHEAVTCDRFKAPHLNVTRGNRALAYQLLHGDPVDNIPRLLLRNKAKAIEIFNSSNALKSAIEFVGEDAAIGSLCALALPTPLLLCEPDIISCVLERHKP